MGDRHFLNPYPDHTPSTPVAVDEKFTAFVTSLINKYVKSILANTEPRSTNERSDIYVGSSGIAFMFLKLSQSTVKHGFAAADLAKLYSDCAKKSSSGRKPISLLSGDAGIHIVSAAVCKARNEPYEDDVRKLVQAIPAFQTPDYLDDGADEMLVGRCGYLLGIVWLRNQLKANILTSDDLQKLSAIIINSGRDYSKRHKLNVPLMYQYHGREYLGAAHGISAILLSLLMHPLNGKDLEGVRTTIDAILDLQDKNGIFPSKFNKPDSNLVHWCHGAAGVIYLMAKAYLLFGDQKYLESCLRSGDLIWKRGLLHKGPGICHGVAGSGYSHLLLFRLTGDSKHLYRAKKFAEFLENKEFVDKSRNPDRPFSLFEGLSGTICFLIDVLQPESAEFPFMNVHI